MTTAVESPQAPVSPVSSGTSESLLAVQLGLAPAEVRARRSAFIEGEDWHRGPGRTVVWTEAGVARLKERMGLCQDTVLAAAPDPAVPVAGEVVRSNFRNRRLISVALGGDRNRELVLVLVRDAGMYLHGQSLEVRPNGSGWMEARRPRRRGLF